MTFYMQDQRSTNPCKYREMAFQTASDGKYTTFEGGTTDFNMVYTTFEGGTTDFNMVY